MPDYAVGTKFTAKDRVSPAFKRMGQNADRFRDRTSSAFRNASKEGYRFGTVVKGILAANIIRGGVTLVTRGLGTVISEFVKFDETVIGATARFSDLGPEMKNFAQGTKLVEDNIRRLAQGTRFTVSEVGASVNTLAIAGFATEDAFGVVNDQMNLAKATQTDLATATSYTVDLLKSLYPATKNAATNIKNMARMTDSLTAGALSANITLEDMYETITTSVGPIGQQYGISANRVIAFTAALAEGGIKGTKASTAMKNIMLRLADPVISANIEANGVAVANAAGKMRDPISIFEDIAKKLKGLGSKTQLAVYSKLFGLRGITGANILTDAMSNLDQLQKKIDESGGIAKRVGDKIETSLLSKVLKLGSAALESGFKILDAFKFKGKQGIDGLTEAVQNFKVQPIVDSINGLVAAVTFLWSASEPFRRFLPEIIGAWAGYNATLALATAATWLFNGAVAVNPLVLAAAGVAAFVASLVYLERRMGLFSTAWKYWGDQFKALFVDLGKAWDWLVNKFDKFAWLFDPSAAGHALASAAMPGFSMSAPLEADVNGNPIFPAPNAKDEGANNSTFRGTLDITGAPAGSKMQSSHGAPSFDVNLLGVAP